MTTEKFVSVFYFGDLCIRIEDINKDTEREQ